jgi:Tfp pilus assembly protein PilN
VALLQIESDVDKQHVKISAEARTLGAMLDYLRDLEGRSILSDVYLQSHQIQQQDPERPVRFVLTATWLARR